MKLKRHDHTELRQSKLEDPEYAWKHRDQYRLLAGGTDHAEEPSNERPPFRVSFRFKLAASVALFAALWLLFQSEHPLARHGQQRIAAALNEPFRFAAAADWYGRYFSGMPSLIPAFGGEGRPRALPVGGRMFASPVSGNVLSPYAPDRQWLIVETVRAAEVLAIDTGRVIYAEMSQGQGLILMIQHAKGYVSVYAGLTATTLKANDWVKAGEPVGRLPASAEGGGSRLYFALKHHHQYVNPADVVAFD